MRFILGILILGKPHFNPNWVKLGGRNRFNPHGWSLILGGGGGGAGFRRENKGGGEQVFFD